MNEVFSAKGALDIMGWFFCYCYPAATQPLSAASQRFFLIFFAHADVSFFLMGRDPFEGLILGHSNYKPDTMEPEDPLLSHEPERQKIFLNYFKHLACCSECAISNLSPLCFRRVLDS